MDMLLRSVLVGLLVVAGATACAASPSSAPAPAPVANNPPAPAASPAAASPAQSGSSGQQLPSVPSLGRMIVYTTDLTILAEDLDVLPTRVGTLATSQGGYIAGMETKDDGGIPTVVLRVKVPPQRYEDTLRELRALGVEVRDQKAATQDVTEEYSDTQTQIASLEATHAQLLELMKRSGSMEEVLKVQQQAAQVKLQLDRLHGRATALERMSELATITAKAQLASAVFRREYTTVRAALRQAESGRASAQTALRNARTPEDEARARDRLAETVLEIDRQTARLEDLQRKADALHVTLPAVDPAFGNAASAGFEVPVTIRSAWEASLVVLMGVASAVVFLWWLWPIAAVVVWLVRRSSRSLAKRPVVQG